MFVPYKCSLGFDNVNMKFKPIKFCQDIIECSVIYPVTVYG